MDRAPRDRTIMRFLVNLGEFFARLAALDYLLFPMPWTSHDGLATVRAFRQAQTSFSRLAPRFIQPRCPFRKVMLSESSDTLEINSHTEVPLKLGFKFQLLFWYFGINPASNLSQASHLHNVVLLMHLGYFSHFNKLKVNHTWGFKFMKLYK